MVSFLSSSLVARPHYLLLDYCLCCLDELLIGYLLVSMAFDGFLVCCLNSRTNSGLLSDDLYCLLMTSVRRLFLRLLSTFYHLMLGLKNYSPTKLSMSRIE